MKKTAPKAKSRSTVKKSKVTRSVAVKSVSKAPQKKSLVHHYVRQRDDFFVAHPNAQILLGIFIVLVAAFIGVWFWGETQIMNAEIKMQTEAFYTE